MIMTAGKNLSSQHILIDKSNMNVTRVTFFSYETPIFQVIIDNRSKLSCISQMDFYNYMRIFFPTYYNKEWNKQTRTLSMTTKTYITNAIKSYPYIKKAFDFEFKYINDIIKSDNELNSQNNKLSNHIYLTTGYDYDLDTGLVIKPIELED